MRRCVLDVSQSFSRSAMGREGMLSCICPNSTFVDIANCKIVSGRECLKVQSSLTSASDFEKYFPSAHTFADACLGDLAGNAFHCRVFAKVLVAMLSSLSMYELSSMGRIRAELLV